MNILDNPFYLLKASLSDNRSVIMSKAQDASLIADPEQCTRASALLTNPKNRARCEIFYLPGLDEDETQSAISQLEDNAEKLIGNIPTYDFTLSYGNLIASALGHCNNSNKQVVIDATLFLSKVIDDIDVYDLMELINSKRKESRFPMLSDSMTVTDIIDELKQFYIQAIKYVLNQLSSIELVQAMSSIVQRDTSEGKNNCSELISHLVDMYEVETQDFFEQETKNANDKIEALRTLIKGNPISEQHLKYGLEKAKQQLFFIVENWLKISLPLNLKSYSNGTVHQPTESLFINVRSLAIDAIHQQNDYIFAQQIITFLKDHNKNHYTP